jgi:hypothetical protein
MAGIATTIGVGTDRTTIITTTVGTAATMADTAARVITVGTAVPVTTVPVAPVITVLVAPATTVVITNRC